jgi:hypothetical protein
MFCQSTKDKGYSDRFPLKRAIAVSMKLETVTYSHRRFTRRRGLRVSQAPYWVRLHAQTPDAPRCGCNRFRQRRFLQLAQLYHLAIRRSPTSLAAWQHCFGVKLSSPRLSSHPRPSGRRGASRLRAKFSSRIVLI